MDPQRFLETLVNYEKIPGYDYNLKDYRDFLIKFNAPHERIRHVIHIAGTKGKGSTAKILESCFRATGLRTGLFTSPHLRRVNERIRVNNVPISNKELTDILRQIRPHIKKRHHARTFFEVLTTAAFLYFIRKNIDVTLLEVGLGGRLDSTNVTHPVLSIITRIGYDHTHLLGTKIRDIAREKAGIIKPSVPVITIQQRPSVDDVLRKAAAQQGTSVRCAESMHTIEVLKHSLQGAEISVRGRLGAFKTFFPLIGEHQQENLTLALGALTELKRMGWGILPATLISGITQTKLHGRFDIIRKNPLVIFDCAHNEDSFKSLHRTMKILHIKKYILIFGINKGKDFRYCFKYILPGARRVLLVSTDSPRAIPPEVLYKKATKYNKYVEIATTVREALLTARRTAGKKGTIVVTGSMYLWQKEWPAL